MKDNFYLQPLLHKLPLGSSAPWFSTTPVGRNTLSYMYMMVKEICKEGQIEGNKTNHSWRASEASKTPSIATYRKKYVYIKTTMRMLTILREAEEWTRVYLQEACLLFVSAITKSSLYVRQSTCTSNNFTFARPLMGTIFNFKSYWGFHYIVRMFQSGVPETVIQ